MKKKLLLFALLFTTHYFSSEACTGISLRSADGSYFQARTIEWGGTNLNSMYVVVPRHFSQTSLTPTGENGLTFKSKYGYVGMAVSQKEFIAEGINEVGLSAGLFYYPNYGSYLDYNPAYNSITLADLQFVAWILSQFSSVDEVMQGVNDVRIVSIQPGPSSANAIHWRVGDKTGKQIVIEIEEGVVHIHENVLGVLTNAPNYQWHITNLNNYVNLTPENPKRHPMGPIDVFPFSYGSGFLGLPGDFSPPSRFVRIAFFKATAPTLKTARETMLQCFTILNNFDIPIGMEYPKGEIPDLPSATQWTSVIDLTHREIYYKTFYNNSIRRIALADIDFEKVKYQYHELDKKDSQPVETIKIR
ncbi:MAG: choloylglycine hydrolase family protein [Bacteroidales bacterium]|nr:choloylglycine hydrolase family protein [Bacteroidales bacterium]